MDIRALLESGHTKEISKKIVHLIVQDPTLVQELMDCFFDKNIRICQRASWPVADLGEKHPELLVPYMAQMIQNIETAPHDAVIRNSFRTWQFMEVPSAYQGEVFERGFQYILDPKAPIAIRAFSMTVCARICKNIPELKEELCLAIEDQLEHGSSGLKSRGRRIIAELKK